MNNLKNWLPGILVFLLAIGLLGLGVTREVPYGTIRGKLTMEENQLPLPKGELYLQMKVADGQDGYSRSIRTRQDGTFEVRVPVGTYSIEFFARAHEAAPITLTVTEGKIQTAEVAMKPMAPYFNLYASQRVFLPGEEPRFEMSGFTPQSEVTLEAYRLDPALLFRSGNQFQALSRIVRGSEASRQQALREFAGDEPMLRQTIAVTTRDGEGVYAQSFKLPPMKEGLYIARAKIGDFETHQFLNVSQMGILVKSGVGKRVAFASRLDDGKPVQARLVYRDASGQVKSLQGGANGLTELPSNFTGVLYADNGDSSALIDLTISTPEAGGLRFFGYTDRPVYRPGDEIQFKAYLRELQNGAYSVAGDAGITAELVDPDDVVVAKSGTEASGNGSVASSFQLGKEASPGIYFVRLKDPQGREGSISFEVASYRKPEFTVRVTPEKERYYAGEEVRMKVKVEYYFGGPVIGAPVTAYVSRNEIYGDFEAAAEEDGAYGEYVGDFEATTDQNGEAWIRFQPVTDGKALDYRAVTMVTVREGDRYFEGQGGVSVFQGNLRLDVQPESYLASPNSETKFTVRQASVDGETPTSRDLIVEYGREEWLPNDGIRRVVEGKLTARIDGEETVIEVPTGNGGSRTVWVSATDDQNRRVEASGEVWLGRPEDGGRTESRLEIRFDKARYAPGDTATALIRTATPGGSALVTLESEALHQIEVVDLSEGAATVKIPVLQEYSPSVSLSVSRTFGKTLVTSSQGLPVEDGERELEVSVQPSSEKVEPGATILYTVTTKDQQGAPVDADVSLGVVDESVYAIRADNFELVRQVYPERYSTVRLDYSYAEIYLDGGDKGGPIPLRSNFRDTAAFLPFVRTVGGRAEVSIKLPDNLTTWRTTAIALDAQSRAGQATTQVVATKPLVVRLQTPRTLVAGDEAELKAIIRSEVEGQAKVEFRAAGFEILDEASRTVKVGTDPTEVVWRVRATQAQEGQLEVTVRNGSLTDGLRQPLTVRPKAVEYTVSESALVDGKVTIPASKLNGTERTLTASGSIVAGMANSLESLIGFPYGCVEQTMSRFLPSLLVSRILGDRPFAQKERIPEIVADGLSRLRSMQQGNGGWGWWENDESNLFLTAFVLDGLAQAKAAGVAIPEMTTERAREFIEALDEARLTSASAGDRLYLAYAARQWGWTKAIDKLIRGVDPFTLTGRDLGFAYLATNEPVFLTELRKRVQVSGQLASVPSDQEWWGQEATSVAMRAIAQANPADPLLPKFVAQLMKSRRAMGWLSTRDTCFALVAISKVVGEEETSPAQLMVQGVGVLRFDPAQLDQESMRVPVGELNLEVAGGGRAYVQVTEKVVDTELKPSASQGIKLSRRFLTYKPEKVEDGSQRRVKTGIPANSFRQSDLVVVQIQMELGAAVDFVMIEDFFPTGFEVLESENPDLSGDWGFWWDRLALRDDRIAFFRTQMPKGTHTFEYVLRAETAGRFVAMPTQAGNMYSGQRPATTDPAMLEVRRK